MCDADLKKKNKSLLSVAHKSWPMDKFTVKEPILGSHYNYDRCL